MNKRRQFGNYINRLRREKGISLQALCEGLCAYQEISYLETGTRKLDRLLEDALLERLGVGAEDYEYFLDFAEYQKWRHRQHVLHSINYGQFDKAESLLEKYCNVCCGQDGCEDGTGCDTQATAGAATDASAVERLERQFYLDMLAQVRRCRGASASELYNLFERALALTVPGFSGRPLGELALSLKEINLMLETERYRKEGGRPERFWELVTYIENKELDRRGRAKIFSKSVYYLYRSLIFAEEEAQLSLREAQLREKTAQLDECVVIGLLKYCNIALEGLRDNEKMYYFWEILSMKEALLDNLPADFYKDPSVFDKQRRDVREWREAMESVFGEFQVPLENLGHCHLYVMKGVCCINDVICIRRKMLGLTQAELCRGICSIKTLQRLENRKTSPQRDIVSSLFERLGLSGELTRTELVTDSPKARGLMEKMRESFNDQRWEEAEKLADQLKTQVSMDIKSNRQALENAEVSAKWENGKIDDDEYFRKMRNALELTLPFEAFLSEGEKYLTVNEQTCIQNLMLVMDKESPEFMTCLRRFEEMYQPFEEDDLLESVSGTYEFIIGYVRSELGNRGQYDRGDQYNKSILQECVRTRRLASIHDCLYDRWWNYAERLKNGIPVEEELNEEDELVKCVLFSRICKKEQDERFYQKKLLLISN